MSETKIKWNKPGWPWELELITLFFFVISLLVPYYLHTYVPHDATPGLLTGTTNALDVGRSSLSTQFGFLWALGIIALYVFHFAFAAMDMGKITASPLHLFSPCVFAVIAYYRIFESEGLNHTALSFIDGSFLQVVLLVVIVGLITSVLARLRTYRYMLGFDNLNWEVITPALYDGSYFRLISQLHPLIYPPRRYLASNEGIVIEGWFYAMPIGFARIHSLSRMTGSGIMNNGNYYASSVHNLIRIEVHDSIKATYISPADRDDFVRYCSQHIARKTPSHKASATKHGTLHASDTHASLTKHGTRSGATKDGIPNRRK